MTAKIDNIQAVHGILLPGIVFLGALHGSLIAADVAPPAQIHDFLKTHCVRCHDSKSAEANLDLEDLSWDLDEGPTFDRLAKVLKRVANKEMPPSAEPQPSVDELRVFTDQLQIPLINRNRQKYTEFGRTSIRRLNRREYERTVQTLLQITAPLQELLPEEQPLSGFDTVSDGLRISPLHMERFVAASAEALQVALRFTAAPKTIHKRFLYLEQEGVLKNVADDHPVVKLTDTSAVFFSHVSYISKIHGLDIEHSGMYTIRIRCSAHQSPDRPVIARLQAGNYGLGTDRYLGMFDALPDKPQEFELTAKLEKGDYLYPTPDDLTADPDNKGVWNVGGKQFQGAGLAIEWIEVEGPHEPQWPPVSVSRVFGDLPIVPRQQSQWKNHESVIFEPKSDHPAADAERLITDFAARAFRRPLRPGEAEPFVQLAKQALEAGSSFEDALKLGVQAILCSPKFLILDESPGRLDAYALASRLSYFLTSNPPDAELLSAAENKSLLQDDVLRQQVERLLRSARSDDFVHSFVGQWLDLHRINATNPDMRLYPEFDDSLKNSMVEETHAYFREILDNDLPVSNFIDSDFAMLNRRLSEHYGIPGVQGQSIRRVSLPEGSPRGGIMTQASILKVTANGTVTSPVIRGSWMMSRLLNQQPPPPPANVGAIEPDTRGATTIREQLRLHRNNPTCNSCHAKFDPAGFALENFDVIGGWREQYRSKEAGDAPKYKLSGRYIWEYKLGKSIDSSGELSTGQSFADIREFKKLIGGMKDLVARAVTEKLLIYATGNPIELADRSYVDEILQRSKGRHWGLRTIIHEIVQSDLFRSK